MPFIVYPNYGSRKLQIPPVNTLVSGSVGYGFVVGLEGCTNVAPKIFELDNILEDTESITCDKLDLLTCQSSSPIKK